MCQNVNVNVSHQRLQRAVHAHIQQSRGKKQWPAPALIVPAVGDLFILEDTNSLAEIFLKIEEKFHRLPFVVMVQNIVDTEKMHQAFSETLN